MKKIFNIITVGLSTMLMHSCRPTTDVPAPQKGDLDFTRFVSLGNSITSGYADNALYYEGQLNAFPYLLSKQFAKVGGGEFKQPWVSENSVGIGSNGNSKLILSIVNGALTPTYAAATGDMSIFTTSVSSQGPFNNMGVPGAKMTTAVYPGYGNPSNGQGNYNPFFTRMAINPVSSSMLSDAASINPTFFTLFLGNNDVLAYALAGGASDAITPLDGAAGIGFVASLNAILQTLTANGAKGAVANIPNITDLPYFNVVPYNALVLTRQGQVDSLNAAYAPTGIKFQLGANPFIIADTASPIGFRSMQAGELVLMSIPQDQILQGLGSVKPIPSQYILTKSEIDKIETATTAFNTQLKAAAQTDSLAFVDVNGFLHEAKSGIHYNGRDLTTTFVSGGVFSLDGIHLTPIGNAMLANRFITSINSYYNTTIPQLDATNYRGVIIP